MSQNLTFYAARNNHVTFFLLNHSEGKKVLRMMWKNFSIKNNILSNPKGKLILL